MRAVLPPRGRPQNGDFVVYAAEVERELERLPGARSLHVRSVYALTDAMLRGIELSSVTDVELSLGRDASAESFVGLKLPPTVRSIVLDGVPRFDPSLLNSATALTWRWGTRKIHPELLCPRIPWLTHLDLDGVVDERRATVKVLSSAVRLESLCFEFNGYNAHDLLSVVGDLPALRVLEIRGHAGALHMGRPTASLLFESLARSKTLIFLRIVHDADRLEFLDGELDFTTPPTLRDLHLCNVVPANIPRDSPLARGVVSVTLEGSALSKSAWLDGTRDFFHTLASTPEALPLRRLALDIRDECYRNDANVVGKLFSLVVPVRMDVQIDGFGHIQRPLHVRRALLALATAQGGLARRLLDRDGGDVPHALGPLAREIAGFLG